MLTDTIAALSTAPGRSAIAVVRVTGSQAITVAGRVARPGDGSPAGPEWLSSLPSRTAVLSRFEGPEGRLLDHGLVTLFRAPHSYSGQDLVEFSCHGGLLAPALVLSALHAAGARPATPGEFTRRAVLNGKLDLLQAEAVGDLIDATAPAQGRAALHQLEGGLSLRIRELREGLVDLLAMLAYDIDFPEEDDGPIPSERLLASAAESARRIDTLLAGAPAGERLHDGALVVLAGRPNAGKSSLFNALLGADRALVTEIPGTTRDTIEAATEMEGWPIRLADTAGLREADETIERMGIEVSKRYLAAADLTLWCVEASGPVAAEERSLQQRHGGVLVRTKADLAPPDGSAVEGIPVSVLTGEGLGALRQAIVRALFGDGAGYADLEPRLTRERHRQALTRAAEAVGRAGVEIGNRGDPVLAAHHLREGVEALDQLIGIVHPDEVLGRVFSKFCVGK